MTDLGVLRGGGFRRGCMERKVKWNRPEGADYTLTYTSKCGRYRIARKRYASARNGHFANVGYVFTELSTQKQITRDTLRDAKDEAEFCNDPSWEPS